MNASGDAAEQIVRMTLEGVQVAAKITGDNVERLANLLIIAMKDNSNTSVGKASLTKMLKTNKPIKVFEIKDEQDVFFDFEEEIAFWRDHLQDKRKEDFNILIDFAYHKYPVNYICQKYNLTKPENIYAKNNSIREFLRKKRVA